MTTKFAHAHLNRHFLNVKGEEELFRTVVRLVRETAAVDWATVYLVDSVRNTIFFNPRYVYSRANRTRTPETENPGSREVGWRAGLVGQVARSGQGILVDGDSERGKASDVEFDYGLFRQAVLLPLEANRDVLAVLAAVRANKDFSGEDLAVLRMIAAVASAHTYRQRENDVSAVSNRRLQRFFDNLPRLTEALGDFRKHFGVTRYLEYLNKIVQQMINADGLLVLTFDSATTGLLEGHCYFSTPQGEQEVSLGDDNMVALVHRLHGKADFTMDDDLSGFDLRVFRKFFEKYDFLSALAIPILVHPPYESHLVLFSLQRKSFSQFDVQLLRLVKELISILTEANATARTIAYNQRAVTLAEMLAGIYHEMRNSVASIDYDLNSARAVLTRLKSEFNDKGHLSSQAAHLLKKLEAAGVDCKKCAERLRLLKRFRGREEELTTLNVRQLNLNDLLRAVVLGTATSAEEKGVDIEFEFDSTLPPIKSDGSLIEECATNLLLNAIYFTPRGSKIVVGTDYLTEETLPIHFWVSDQGGGIHTKDLESIYRPFFSTKKSGDNKSDDQSGSGIGLFLTRNNVRLLGGNVSVKTAIPKGSRFTIKLPKETH